jgi:hypothetical protein
MSNLLHKIPFSTGGYVIHGIKSTNGAKISAWFNTDNALVDYEKVLRNGTCRRKISVDDLDNVKRITRLLEGV